MSIEKQFNLIAREYDIIISALSIHHLKINRKRNCFVEYMTSFQKGDCLLIMISFVRVLQN